MIALTQEKREELIACANEIKKMATGTHGYKVGNDAFGSNALMLMEVALASLKGSVFAYGISDPEGKVHLDEACCIDSDGQWVSDEVTTLNDGVTDLETGYKVVQLFTAPPVPEIKFPTEQDFESWFKSIEAGDDPDWSEPDYLSKKWHEYLARRQLALGIYQLTIEEFKRLNEFHKRKLSPAQEIKMPPRIENIHLRTPLEVEDMWIARFKRLNGLGE